MVVPLLLAAALVDFRALATQPAGGGRPQVAAIVAAVVSFLLWVVMLGDSFWPSGTIDDRTRAIAGAVAGVWVWLAPLIVERLDAPNSSGGDGR